MKGITARVPGDLTYVERKEPTTSIGLFHSGDTLAELLNAATVVERLGYMPELRFAGTTDDPSAVELFVRDVPALIGKLRASLDATAKENLP